MQYNLVNLFERPSLRYLNGFLHTYIKENKIRAHTTGFRGMYNVSLEPLKLLEWFLALHRRPVV